MNISPLLLVQDCSPCIMVCMDWHQCNSRHIVFLLCVNSHSRLWSASTGCLESKNLDDSWTAELSLFNVEQLQCMVRTCQCKLTMKWTFSTVAKCWQCYDPLPLQICRSVNWISRLILAYSTLSRSIYITTSHSQCNLQLKVENSSCIHQKCPVTQHFNQHKMFIIIICIVVNKPY